MLKQSRSLRGIGLLAIAAGLAILASAPAWAQEAAETASTPVPFTKEMAEQLANAKMMADTIWTLVTAFLVFFMNLGFAMVESGFCRAKNRTNVLSKNFIVFAISSIAFLLTGFGLMFGDGTGFIGTKGIWFLSGADNSPAMGDAYKGVFSSLNWTGIPLWAKFMFQLVFAGTAATIVSGAVAERIKFAAFFLFSFLMVGIIYPTTGHWIWGGGWLQQRGMLDFAGSTVVHSVGGWAALAGAIMLGARIGKYTPDGRINAIPGHSLTSATVGVFVLWFGWFGFNPGSTMAVDWTLIGHIATTTNTAAAAAAISATLTAWVLLGKPDFTMALNGGLVAITAPCAFVSVGSSLLIGLGAGLLVVPSVLFFDRIKVDDPVGAVSVHLTGGAYGTLCVGLFAEKAVNPALAKNGLFFGGGPELFQAQLMGVLAVGAFTFAASIVGWSIIKGLVGLRVSPEEEIEGLDIGEHGNIAYPDFAIAAAGRGTTPFAARPVEEMPVREEVAPAFQAALQTAGAGRATGSRNPTAFSRKPPTREEASRPAMARQSVAGQEKPFKLVVRGAEKRAVKEIWQRLCYDYPGKTPKEFNEIYPHGATFAGDTFTFRRGDPSRYKETMENVLYQYGIEQPVVTVEG